MNIMEKLAREIARVAVMQERYQCDNDEPNPHYTEGLEAAYIAAGSGEAMDIITALKWMERFQDGQ